MLPGHPVPGAVERALTAGERAALSPGLWEALERAGASPRIAGVAHWLARLSRLWRGHVPILTLRDRIFWADVPADCSAPGFEQHMAVLQHELQHVLEFASGDLSLAQYATRPRNWRYGYALQPGKPFHRYGAEQRASIVEDLWRIEHGLLAGPAAAEAYRALIPWAR